MKILNLIDLDKSDIKYQIQKFPDGQQNIVIGGINLQSEWLHYLLPYIKKEGVQIKSRLNNFQDLELITCATKSLRNLGVKEIHLYTPYFLGARCDRQFEEGGNNYLKDVICPIINSLNFESVTVQDAHSDVLEACLNNFKKISNLELVKFTLNSLNEINNSKLPKGVSGNLDLSNFILISPDAGATKKIYKIAQEIGYDGDIITCSKDRDIDGKLTKTNVPFPTHRAYHKDYIIIDDICDGGATFINIAKEIKQGLGKEIKIYLIVTHSIFSKGLEELSKYFDGIYCTNSYKDLQPDEWLFNIDRPFVKQLNVF